LTAGNARLRTTHRALLIPCQHDVVLHGSAATAYNDVVLPAASPECECCGAAASNEHRLRDVGRRSTRVGWNCKHVTRRVKTLSTAASTCHCCAGSATSRVLPCHGAGGASGTRTTGSYPRPRLHRRRRIAADTLAADEAMAQEGTSRLAQGRACEEPFAPAVCFPLPNIVQQVSVCDRACLQRAPPERA